MWIVNGEESGRGLSWTLLRGSIQSGVDENLEMIMEYTQFRECNYDNSSTAVQQQYVSVVDGFNFNR